MFVIASPSPRPDLIAALSDLRAKRTQFLDILRDIVALHRPRVLIVDDNRAYAVLLANALASRHVRADCAEEAHPARAETDCDLVVLDGVGGCHDYGDTPIMRVSGHDDAEAAGALSKSLGIEAIADAIAARVR